AYAQRDPLNEYKREAFELFDDMLARFREMVVMTLAHVEIRLAEPPPPELTRTPEPALAAAGGNGSAPAPRRPERALAGAAAGRDPRQPQSWGKIGRNEPCPCGSGRKYKHCHGRV
ncbi:MAG TPA: SEC-C metal-binding domain-containing protein, partial [Alphaproteobacteria bacterium]